MLIRTESRLRFAEDGIHPERRRKTELAMAEVLTKLMKKVGDAESDSGDSLICACDSPMLMRFSDAHDVLRC